MKFEYIATTADGAPTKGVYEADDREAALRALRGSGLVVSKITEKKSLGELEFNIINRVQTKDVVLLSRQLATLFNANISTLRIFSLLSEEVDNPRLKEILEEIVADLEAGQQLSVSLAKHPKVFSKFYVNMIASGEETGRLPQTFQYLAEYLERNYELASKARSALTYPVFVVFTFFIVMILMLTYIIPKIGVILTESGQDLPVYTKIVLGTSAFLVNYGFILLTLLILAVAGLIYFLRQPTNRERLTVFALHTPFVGNLYRKIYLARFADNMHTMLSSGISMLHALETSREVIGNKVYAGIISDSIEEVRSGKSLSDALSNYPDYIPGVLVQMIRVGEESGKIGTILGTLSKYYKDEVTRAVDSLVDLIEPAMIVFLGIGVGTLLAAVLFPIYNISTGI
jgi:type IV pilus assembly protein PilC